MELVINRSVSRKARNRQRKRWTGNHAGVEFDRDVQLGTEADG